MSASHRTPAATTTTDARVLQSGDHLKQPKDCERCQGDRRQFNGSAVLRKDTAEDAFLVQEVTDIGQHGGAPSMPWWTEPCPKAPMAALIR